MALARQQDIGPVYDLLLATRDGTTLPCKNKDGSTLNLSQLAFMTSIDRQQQQHEETELQHKDALIQLASSNLIDREFDQWPQVTQGDWSGGALQRVLTGASPVTSFTPQSDPSRYWDGIGVLWPVSDSVPSAGTLADVDANEGGNGMKNWMVGTVTGALQNSGHTNPTAFAYFYQQTNAPHNNVFVVQGDGWQNNFVNPPGTVASQVITPNLLDYDIGLGRVWLLSSNPAGTLQLSWTDGSGTAGSFVSFMTIATAAPIGSGALTTGQVGNRLYIAFGWKSSTAGSTQNIRLVDVSGNLATAFTDIPIPNSQSATPNTLSSTVQQILFLGDNLIVVLSGQDIAGSTLYTSGTIIAQYAISSGTWTTLATFPTAANCFVGVAAGTLFVIAWEAFGQASSSNVNTAELYLLQSSSLQHIGQVIVQPTTQGAGILLGATFPVGFGPYAVYGVYYIQTPTSPVQLAIFAYDVLRGRLFKVQNLTNLSTTSTPPDFGFRMAVVSRFSTNTVGGTSTSSQWLVAAPVLGRSGVETKNVQRILVGTATSTGVLLRQGVTIVSSLIDFTSAQPKLFRQAVLIWLSPGLPNDSAITVKLDVWLDQDPDLLSAVPTFTTGVIGVGAGGGTVGQTSLSLPINKMARKLVYRVTTTGPSGLSNPAVKLDSIAIQASTGWTRTMMLDLADNVVVNGKNAMCWDTQSQLGSPAVDATAAYNFLRQLWRLKGGEVSATFPNGDAPANWLLQDIHYDSPKPFGVSMRADQKSSLGFLVSLKLREDI